MLLVLLSTSSVIITNAFFLKEHVISGSEQDGEIPTATTMDDVKVWIEVSIMVDA